MSWCKALLLLFFISPAVKAENVKAANVSQAELTFPFDLPKGYGAWTRPTSGEVWPKPQLQKSFDSFMVLRPNFFQFQVSQPRLIFLNTANSTNNISQIKGHSCDIIDEAVRRYYDLIFYPSRGSGVSKRFLKHYKKMKKNWETSELFQGYLDTVVVDLMKPCEKYPSLSMDENCKSSALVASIM